MAFTHSNIWHLLLDNKLGICVEKGYISQEQQEIRQFHMWLSGKNKYEKMECPVEIMLNKEIN